MTLKRMMTTVVVATPVGSPPPYARLGQGVMGGTIAAMVEGDAVDAKLLLDELQQVFGIEFDRGELTVETLRPVLWAAHWLKAIRPVAQRASELLTLAAERAFEPGSKAARDCGAVARVMASVATTEPHCLTAIEAARKIRVPGDFYSRGGEITALPAGRISAEDVEPLSSRAFSSEELVQLDSSKEGREGLYHSMLDAGMFSKPELESALRTDGITPTALLTADESQALAEQIRSTAAAVEAVGSVASKDESPFAVYEFPHEMYAALRQVSEILGGIREVEKQALEPTPDMLKAGVKVLADVDELMGRIDGESGVYRPTVLTDKKMVDEAMRHRDEKDRQAQADAVQRKLDELHTRAVNDRHACKVSARRSLQELERLERGLMALAKVIGPMATEKTLAAMEKALASMERPA